MEDFELWEVILVNTSKQERLMMEKYDLLWCISELTPFLVLNSQLI